MIDLLKMQEITRRLYVPMVEKNHGQSGTNTLKELLDFVRSFYSYVAPDMKRPRILIFKHLTDIRSPLFLETDEILSVRHLPSLSPQPLTVQVFSTGRLLLSQTIAPTPQALAQDGIVYTFEAGVEMFHAKDESAVVLNPFEGYSSVFAIPTFDELYKALLEYKLKQARQCSCKILAGAWDTDKRIHFREAPESTMRDSLTQFLKNCLRGDVEVRPEQVVSDSHPVDIKVTWYMSNRLALIEIKWLGASKGASGKLTSYTEVRARKGAKQLKNYLDQNLVHAPTHQTRGYLVVFDGRRASISATTLSLSSADGMKYANEEIKYSPEYHKLRQDFEIPLRMFVEPVSDDHAA
jgi:hypothetical protein